MSYYPCWAELDTPEKCFDEIEELEAVLRGLEDGVVLPKVSAESTTVNCPRSYGESPDGRRPGGSYVTREATVHYVISVPRHSCSAWVVYDAYVPWPGEPVDLAVEEGRLLLEKVWRHAAAVEKL